MSCAGGTFGDCYAETWAKRVVYNGGARPSSTTITAAAAFFNALETAGIVSKMQAVNIVAPDSITAAITPFIRRVGNDPWTNGGPFIAGDLTVDGLKGNGSSKYLNTGVKPSTALANENAGLTVYLKTYPHLDGTAIAASSDVVRIFGIYPYSSAIYADCWTTANAITVSGNRGVAGCYSMSRRNTPSFRFYHGVGSTLSEIGSSDALNGTTSAENLLAFANTGPSGYFSGIISFIAIHDGLTQAETLDLYNAAVALRTSLGGGLAPDPDNATEMTNDWAARVVANGGAAVSVGTKAAATTFWQAIIDAGIRTKIKGLTFLAPDSLIAAITPYYKGTANDPWTNSGFVAGDLTVNGLKGNGVSNRLLTGLFPSAFATTTNFGLTAYVSDYVAESAKTMIGTYVSDGQMELLALADSNVKWGNFYWAAGNGTLYAASTSAGYYSGNRTAANATAIYFAKAASAHSALATASWANGTFSPNQILGFSEDAAGYATAHRLSLLAVHLGLSSSESADFYDAIQALRTALGGGYV